MKKNFGLNQNFDFLHETELSDGTIRMEDDIKIVFNHLSF